MTKVLVLYYSSYGHIEQMADAVAEGARAGGAEVDIRRVAETAPKEVVEAAHFKTDTAHPVIEGPDALADYDAIIVGAPTRYGRMPSQMAAFWDTTGGLWMRGGLVGKVTRVEDTIVEVEIAPNVKVRVVKATLAEVTPLGGKPAND